MKNAIFCDVAACGSCYNRRFQETCCFHLWGGLLVAANVPSTWILSTLKAEATRLHIPEDSILQR
jgi:hypothetical protein